MIAAIITRLVDFSRRHSVANALAALILVLAAGWYAAGHLAIDTDIEKLLPADLERFPGGDRSWKQDRKPSALCALTYQRFEGTMSAHHSLHGMTTGQDLEAFQPEERVLDGGEASQVADHG